MSILSALLGSSPACSADANWARLASTATYLGPGQVKASSDQLRALPRAQQQVAGEALERIAAVPLTLDGLEAARKILQETAGKLHDPNSRIDGTEPAVAAFLSAAQITFQGLVLGTGKAIAAGPDAETKATALVRWTRQISELGPDGAASLSEEAQVGLGGELYTAALRSLAAGG